LENGDAYCVNDISRITQTFNSRRAEEANALAVIGMLCASGLPLRSFIRILPDLVRAAFAVDTVGFFWSAPNGDMIDAYVEEPHFLSAEVLHSCQIYQEEEAGNWPSFAENVLAGPVAGYLLPYQTPAFYTSHHFDFTYAKIKAHHILDAVVHDGIAPLGCFLLMRSRVAGPFSAHEIALARSIAQLISICFTGNGAALLPTRRLPAGVVMVDACDAITFRNRAAHQSLWMLGREGIDPMLDTRDDDFECLWKNFVGSSLASVRATGGEDQQIANSWGDFSIRYDLGEMLGSVMISFEQDQAFLCSLARQIASLKLPPRRIIVCWLVATGYSRKEIAWRLGIGIDTVGEQIEALFAHVGVKSSFDLVRHLSG
jgi:DNA-binding CsgD family transcriptional regulator